MNPAWAPWTTVATAGTVVGGAVVAAGAAVGAAVVGAAAAAGALVAAGWEGAWAAAVGDADGACCWQAARMGARAPVAMNDPTTFSRPRRLMGSPELNDGIALSLPFGFFMVRITVLPRRKGVNSQHVATRCDGGS